MGGAVVNRLLAYLPRGNMLDHEVWRKRHRLLQWVLFIHLPGLFLFGLGAGRGLTFTLWTVAVLPLCIAAGMLTRYRRFASIAITAGLVYCSAALVGLSGGSIEAHFHFFVMIGFIALYQDWVPFLWNVVFTVLSHGVGSLWRSNLIFNHPAGQANPWVWSGIHGLAVLFACVGVVIFWRTTEDEQQKSLVLTNRLADAEIARRKFTSDLLVNLARRNQSLLYRQLSVINQLEEHENDPDALADLFRLDHLATRIRRNAESLLVLSGEEPPRTWSRPVLLVDVVRAAIAETEDLDRVVFDIDEHLAVSGKAVADLTHLLAELVENAVHFSPPQARVIIRTRPYLQRAGAQVLSVEDWGVGLRQEDIDSANQLLADPPEVDLSVSQRLGLHVVARLAQRHGINVSLTPTPGCGVTAVVALPGALFSREPVSSREPVEPAGMMANDQLAPPVPAMAAQRPAAAVASTTTAPSMTLPQPHANGAPGSGWPDSDDSPTWPGWFPVAREGTAAEAPGGAAPRRPLEPAAPPAPRFRASAPPPEPAGPLGPPEPAGPLGSPEPVRPVTPPPSAAPPGAPPPPRPAPVPAPPGPPPQAAAPPGRPAPVPAPLGPAPPAAAPRWAHVPSPQAPPQAPARAQPPAEPAQYLADVPRLTRRVPQAHLAPELRRQSDDSDQPATPVEPPAPADAVQARNALSRYQASRRAAQALVEGSTDDDGDRPVPGGGWT
jgi:signal transduction histidine kinase